MFFKSRAARFIAVVADCVVDRKFRPGTFDLMAKDNNLWSSLASEVASTSRGRDYLRQVKKEMKKSNERSEEHTSELQSLMRISYAVFCLKKKKNSNNTRITTNTRDEP